MNDLNITFIENDEILFFMNNECSIHKARVVLKENEPFLLFDDNTQPDSFVDELSFSLIPIEINNDNSLRWFNEHLASSINTDLYFGDSIKFLENLIREKIEFLINFHNYSLIATDTHRWVETDGFYEVQFELHKNLNTSSDFEDLLIKNNNEGNYIYLLNISGDNELEEEWSRNNPQVIDTYELINFFDDNWKRLDIIETLNKKIFSLF